VLVVVAHIWKWKKHLSHSLSYSLSHNLSHNLSHSLKSFLLFVARLSRPFLQLQCLLLLLLLGDPNVSHRHVTNDLKKKSRRVTYKKQK
jgi:hypothetical protein